MTNYQCLNCRRWTKTYSNMGARLNCTCGDYMYEEGFVCQIPSCICPKSEYVLSKRGLRFSNYSNIDPSVGVSLSTEEYRKYIRGDFGYALPPLKIKNNKMNIRTLIKKITRVEPEKTFLKAGFINDCDEITDLGEEALIEVLWNANKDALKELADKIVADKENK